MDQVSRALLIAGGAEPSYVDDVFSTFLYDGNGSTQTITNGIDLAGKGGMVWIKSRAAATGHYLLDTTRGGSASLNSELADAAGATSRISAFNAAGFSLTSASGTNTSAAIYTAWTFREASKFFDVVTYTGNGANRTIAHDLAQVPGMIIVKRTDTTGAWQVYHRSFVNTEYMVLNTTAAKATGATRWNSTTPTDSVFSLGTDATVNASGGTYVAYLFAHDTAADGLIQCGSYSGTGSSPGPTITLGWEPQFVLIKLATGGTGDWHIFDSVRGITSGGADPGLLANTADAENSFNNRIRVNATGFALEESQSTTNGLSSTYIYVAIRRPNKPPTSAAQVFTPTVYTGTNVDNRLVNTTIAPDLVMVRQRTSTTAAGMVVGDRLRGQPYLRTGNNSAENNDANSFDQQLVSAVEYGTAFSAMNGFWCGNDTTSNLNANTSLSNHIAFAFKRAPGFFDSVVYSGNGTASRTINHSLGVSPQLCFVKGTASLSCSWAVTANTPTVGQLSFLLDSNFAGSGDDSSAVRTNGYIDLNASSATAFVVSVGTTGSLNVNQSSSVQYVAYLFASAPGIQYISTYVGDGTTGRVIDCGFSAGARFVCIKATSTTGDWLVGDTARGIVSASDPRLTLNSTSGESTSDDWLDPHSSGFIVNQVGGLNPNVSGVTYLVWAIA